MSDTGAGGLGGRARLAACGAVAFLLAASPTIVAADTSARAATARPNCKGYRADIVGTPRADHIVGTSRSEVIVARGGADVIEGRGGNDLICAGKGPDQVNAGGGDDEVHGQRGHDKLRAGAGLSFLDTLDGGAGNDVLTGSPGELQFTRAFYLESPEPVVIDMRAGTATGHGNDTLERIDDINGSRFDDMIRGNYRDNFIVGEEGDDSIDGGGGDDGLDGSAGDDAIDGGGAVDCLFYDLAEEPVNVDLASGTATGLGNDSLTAAECIIGSPFGDTLIGADTDDTFVGGAGDDEIAGSGGRDTARFTGASGDGVLVDLETGDTSGGDGNDALIGIEDVVGTFYDDTISGDDGANLIWGSFGNDALFGRGGDDEIDGGFDNDSADGGDGIDVCFDVEEDLNCEGSSDRSAAPGFFRRNAPLRDLSICTRIVGVSAGAAGTTSYRGSFSSVPLKIATHRPPTVTCPGVAST